MVTCFPFNNVHKVCDKSDQLSAPSLEAEVQCYERTEVLVLMLGEAFINNAVVHKRQTIHTLSVQSLQSCWRERDMQNNYTGMSTINNNTVQKE